MVERWFIACTYPAPNADALGKCSMQAHGQEYDARVVHFVDQKPKQLGVCRPFNLASLSLGGSTVCLAARGSAHQDIHHVIGLLRPTRIEDSGHLVAVLRPGLRESGYYKVVMSPVGGRWPPERLPK